MEPRRTRLPRISTLLSRSLLTSQRSTSPATASTSDPRIQQQLQVLDALVQQLGSASASDKLDAPPALCR